MTNPRSVAVIALDAVEPSLARQGIDEGWLPVLASLADRGRWVGLRDDPPILPGGVWGTTITGHPPWDHGMFFDRMLRLGSYRVDDVTPAVLRRRPFWGYVSDAGLSSTIVSIYGAPALEPFLGTQVIGWGTHDPFTTKVVDPYVDPPAMRALLDEVAPSRQSGFLTHLPESPGELRTYVEGVVRRISAQGKALAALVERTDWRLFFGAVTETHESGHLLWGFSDPSSPHYDPLASPDLRDAIRTVYRASDAALGMVLERVPSDATVFAMSPHGMGTHNRMFAVFESVLEANGWLVRQTRPQGGTSTLRWARHAAHRLLPLAARRRLADLVPRQRMRLEAATRLADVDWTRTRAFVLPHDRTSLVRLNLAGREPGGIVAPGPAYDALCDEIIDRACELVDHSSGRTLAESGVRLDALLGRDVDDGLPDLVVQWRPESPASVSAPGVPPLRVPYDDPHTGAHTPLGFLLGAGPAVDNEADSHHDAVLPDFAPTILRCLGLRPPPDMPGRPIEGFGG